MGGGSEDEPEEARSLLGVQEDGRAAIAGPHAGHALRRSLGRRCAVLLPGCGPHGLPVAVAGGCAVLACGVLAGWGSASAASFASSSSRSRPSFAAARPSGSVVAADAAAVQTGIAGCTQSGGYNYSLDWKAAGSTFWDEWNYLTFDANSGAAEYLVRDKAVAAGVTVAHATHALLRAGPRGSYLKRTSAKLETTRKWTYFLMALKYESVPWGCGVWPALWTHSPDAPWPQGGELDILEYASEIPSRTSLHVDAKANPCRLSPQLLRRPGCPQMLDAEYNFTGDYDCATAYPAKLGCAPNVRKFMLSGEELARQPSVVAAEWTPEYLKVFRIPAEEVPADLAAETPRPDGWDKWLISYYPFSESERLVPGSCPNPEGVLKAQKIVLSLGFCGDWASKVWVNSTCANRGSSTASRGPWSSRGPVMGSECVAVDPHNPAGEVPAGPRDCCTRFIYDEHGEYLADEYLGSRAFWNVSWLKVFQHRGQPTPLI